MGLRYWIKNKSGDIIARFATDFVRDLTLKAMSVVFEFEDGFMTAGEDDG